MIALPKSKSPPKRAAKDTPSGQHPAVKAYRAKLDSVAECPELSKLDADLEKFLAGVKSDPPPSSEGS